MYARDTSGYQGNMFGSTASYYFCKISRVINMHQCIASRPSLGTPFSTTETIFRYTVHMCGPLLYSSVITASQPYFCKLVCQASRKTRCPPYRYACLSALTGIKENINQSTALLILAVTLTSRKQVQEATTGVRSILCGDLILYHLVDDPC